MRSLRSSFVFAAFFLSCIGTIWAASSVQVIPAIRTLACTTNACGGAGLAVDPAGNATITNNALDVSGSTQTIALSGNATPQPTTTTLTSSANPSVTGQSVTFTATVSPQTSGTPTGTVTFTLYNINGPFPYPPVALVNGEATLALALNPMPGSWDISARYSGDTNFLTSTSSTLHQTVNPAATSTALSSSLNPSIFGQSVTFTATVTVVPPGQGTPLWGVVVFEGPMPTPTRLGSGVYTGSGQWTFTTSSLPAGSHGIWAAYNVPDMFGHWDPDFGGSSSPIVTQNVNQASTTTAVSSSGTPTVLGQSVTFTATVAVVSPGVGTPTGTVTFKDGSTALGTGTLNGSLQATFKTSSLPAGSHSITAVYGGDTNFSTSTSTTIAQVVNRVSYTAPSATGTGIITASFTSGDAGCGYTVAQFIPLTGNAASPPAGSAPAGVTFPHGLFDFTVGCTTSGRVLNFTITYPQPLPPGTQYWKYGPTPGGGANTTPHWYVLPAVISGNTVTFSITDGGLGDDDRAANGLIVDQGGPGVPPITAIPTLSKWALAFLALQLLGFGAQRVRYRR